MPAICALGSSYRYYWKTGLVALAILITSLAPMPYVPVLDFSLADKWEHLLAYALLTLLFLIELKQNQVACIVRWVIGIGLPVLYGGLIECLQALPFIHRSMSLYDWLADIIGVVAGSAIYALAVYIRKR